ncbi:MAG: carbon-nitrogen hydrolase family protein [Pseudomonadales bacterium]
MSKGIAVLQMSSSANRVENLQCVEALIATAVEQGANVLVLPENFALLGVEGVYLAGLDETRNSHDSLRQWLASMARQYSVWLVAGSIPMASRPDGTQLDRHVRAACLVFNEHGDEVARYDKIHLFDVDVADEYGSYRESDTVEPGDQLVVVDTPCGRLGLTICYDLRFAEQFYQLREKGAEIITVPSAFTATTGAAHWEILLRARAIETQCYVVAPNQTGQHSATRHSYGHSMIVDPWGEVLARLEDEAGVVSAEVDLKRLAAVRERMPVQQHHRLIFK